MKTCTFDGCDKKCYATGLCKGHYSQKLRGVKLTMLREKGINNGKCKVPGCNEKYKAKGYCNKHYVKVYKTGTLNKLKKGPVKIIKGICSISNCGKNCYTSKTEYCQNHYSKFLKYGDPLGSSNIKGIRNPRWNGGVSQYKDHYKFKKVRLKVRLVVLSNAKYKCEMCGKKATQVHHKDNTKSNHEISNLMALCCRCHISLHRNGRPRLYPDSFYVACKNIPITMMTLLKYKDNPSILRKTKRDKIEKYFSSLKSVN